jgi:hypothetical protein
MRISGCTFGRNLLRAGYPILESMRSILPIVDEFVVVVGQGDDGTLEAIRSIGDPKIRIIETIWNPHVNTGGFVLTQQTNIGLFNCTGDWAIAIQADEIVHERDHARLVELMRRHKDDDGVEGLAMSRLTFYQDARTVIDAYPLFRDRVVRIVKPHRFVLARGDSSGFSVYPKYKNRGRAIRVVDSGATLFHYGPWKDEAFQVKQEAIEQLWSNAGPQSREADPYLQVPRQFVTGYEGDHPAAMAERIAERGNRIDLDSPRWRRTLSPVERRRLTRTWLVRNVSDLFHRRRDHRLVRR